ncbi:MAG: alpha/beta fold hydrolase [Novosphingobium sp.]
MLIPIDGRRIHCDLIGREDAPVICMAHCLSSDSTVWAEQVPPLLDADWRILRIDMRGHGGSDPDGDQATMAELADDVIRVLDFLGVEKVHFAGVSIGGMIGQQLALDHAHRLHSALLSGTSPNAVPGPPDMWPNRFAQIASAGSLDPIADEAMTRWVTEAFQTSRPGRWRQIRQTIAATSPDGYAAGARAIIHFEVLARLPSVRLPVLVICGDDDRGTPAEGNRKIAKLIPGARYVEMENARHLPMVEYPDLYARIMREWLNIHR